MRSSKAQAKLSDDREKEYQRQQERMNARAATSEKTQAVTADMMIENLLKNSCKKVPEISTPVEQMDHFCKEFPLWLQCDNAAVPAQYKYLWSLVQATADLADTEKVSRLLLTSGLQVDVLGFIWSLTNKMVPGQLTKQEFYIVLALVTLVQTGYTFNNLSILKLFTVPLLPVLQLDLLKFPVPHFDILQKTKGVGFDFNKFSGLLRLQSRPPISVNESNKKDHFISMRLNESIFLNDCEKNLFSLKETSKTDFESKTGDKRTPKLHLIEHVSDLHINSNFPCIGSSPTAEIKDDFSAFQSVSMENNNKCKKVNQTVNDSYDEFSEFQSATIEHLDPFETVVLNQKREIPKILLPKTLTGKFSDTKSGVLKISPESEKKLKVFTATESLSSLPESKISSSNKVSTSVTILGSNHGIGSRLANHSFSSKFEKTKCHKNHKFKLNPNSPIHPDEENKVILGLKPKNLETVMPNCHPKNSTIFKTLTLKETKIRSDVAIEPPKNKLLGGEVESSDVCSAEKTRQIDIPMLGTFNETVLPTQSKPQVTNVDLLTVQEDKYSALREIELELNQQKDSVGKERNDDFGDFLSADISALGAQKFPRSSVKPSDPNSHLDLFETEDKDTWGDWNFSTEMSLNLSNISEGGITPTNYFANVDSAPNLKANVDLFGPFNLLNISDKKETSQSITIVSNKQDYFDSKYNDANNGIMFGKKSDEPSHVFSQLKADQTVDKQLDNEFWSFLMPETKLSNESTFSRHSSLLNLDLNTPPTDESEQEIVWRKCIESCHSLIREGFDIFNNILTKSVLDEVFAAPETEIYLNNLNIVCHISRRVFQNFNAMFSSQNELKKLWERLQELCFEYNIKLKPDEDNFSEGKYRCSICFRHVGRDVVNQGISYYHPSCANLWVNFVEEILPPAV